MKRVLPLHTLALLASLLCCFTATAYDFQVDLLYYNITSPTTVEVDSCIFYYGCPNPYQGCEFDYYIHIPKQVYHNNINYTVTAIGDSAFYNSAVASIVIPETVTSIGRDAFAYSNAYSNLGKVICLSMTPPSLDESFNCIDFLVVNEDAYDNYISEYGNKDIFNHILCFYEGEPLPIYYDVFNYYGGYVLVLNKVENCRVFRRCNNSWTPAYGFEWDGYEEDLGVNSYYEFSRPYISRTIFYDCLAIIDNKYYQDVHIFDYIGNNDADHDEVFLQGDWYTWNICVDNIYYSFNIFGDDDDYKTREFTINLTDVTVTYDGYRPEYKGPNKSWPNNKISYYSGDVIIPNTIHFAIWDYYVEILGAFAFSDCKDLRSVTLPNTITEIGASAFAGCSNLKKLVLPVSVAYIAEDAFENCSVDTVYLTGEGEWQGGALPGGVKTLFIGSGVTGVMGMQVNPETIYSYATTPPACDENSFTGYGAELHVPAASLAAYFTAPYWCNFTNIVGDAVPLTELTLNHDSIEVLVGNQANLTATLNPTNAMPSAVIWQSSDTTVATVNNGVVTALGAGSCDIIATCQDKRAVCHVTVTEIVPTAVTVTPESAKIEVGTQLTLTATVLPEDATDKTISWSTSKSSVATVDANGVVTAVGPGECDITARCRNKSAKCHLIVVEHLIYITLDQHEASLLPNHMITLTPSVAPVSTDLVVTSSNPEVAAARLAGNKIQVVGVSEGEATIVIGSADGYAEPDSCLVTVYTERGDANNDGFVNISDVTSMITYLMTGNASDFSTVNADCNGDGKVTISDVTLLISHLMSGTELKPKDQDNEEITVNGVTFKMMRVKGGTFQMGSTTDQDPDAEAIESPVHAVTLSTYYIGMTEVTQELWQAVMGENPSEFTGDAQRPVERVTWDMCQEFITTLNALTGKTFRLPTEAEWEFAALGGNKSAGYRYAGSNDIDEVAWYSLNSDSAPHPVGLKAPNELGLFDMTGNVGEWCADRYGYYTEDAQTDPQGPETGKSRIYRGGSWSNNAKSCRLTRRAYFSPATIRNNMGLRLAL